MNRIKLLMVSVLAISMFVPAMVVIPSVAHAVGGNANAGSDSFNINQSLCNGANNVGTNASADCTSKEGSATQSVQKLVNTVISVFSWVVGIVSVIMIIWGGFRYITSGGDSDGVTSAKNTILFAIVGLVIVALAQIIVKFVIGTVSDVTTENSGNNPN